MSKIIFKRIGGRIVPIKTGKKMSKFMTNKEASDHYMAKGLKKMIRDDVKPTGRLIHEKANLNQMLSFVEDGTSSKSERNNKIFKKAKDFLKKNKG